MPAVATLPDKATLAAAELALAEAGAPETILPKVVKAFGEGEWTADTLDSWVAMNNSLWIIADKPVSDAASAAQAELADKAFEGKGNASARAALVRNLGVEETNKIAREQFGLAGYGDFVNLGKRKVVVADKADAKGDDKGDKSTNPWLDTSPTGEARRTECFRSLGTNVCNEFAKAAGKTISGQPLRR